LINSNKVVAFDGGRMFVMHDDEKIDLPIGATYREKIQKLFPKLRSD